MKKVISLLITTFMFFSMAGCSKNAKAGEEQKVIPVKVMDAKEEKYPILLEYMGNTDSKDIIKYSFKIPGKIAGINVKEGDYVKAGDVIATLDSKDYNFAVNASSGQMQAASGQVEAAKGQMEAAKGKIGMAEAQMAAAKAQYDKSLNGAQKEDINRARLAVKNAEDTHNYAKQSYDRVKKLYDEGIVSKQQLDDIKIKLDGSKVALDNSKEVLSKAENGARDEDKRGALAQYNASKSQYEAAKSQYSAAQGQHNAAIGQKNAAQTQYESKQSMLDDTVLTSGVSGYVTKILNKSGENTAAGYPVLLVRTDNQVIDIQIAQNDIEKVKIGTKVNVNINDLKTDGSIIEIEQMPDVKSRTYKAKIKMNKKVPKDKFYIGTVAKVNIKLREQTGIWLPITVVLNDGEDYVYVVDKGRISRKNVAIQSIYSDKVLLKGVSKGEKIVTEGLKNIKPGYKANIVK